MLFDLIVDGTTHRCYKSEISLCIFFLYFFYELNHNRLRYFNKLITEAQQNNLVFTSNSKSVRL